MESVNVKKNEPEVVNAGKRPLKVLWFTTSPSLSRQHLDGNYNVGTSWIEAMENLVLSHTTIKLAIAFTWKTEVVKPYQIEKTSTRYYAMPRRPVNKWTNLVRSSLCLPEPETVIQDYLQVINDFQPDIVHFFGTETPYPLVIPQLNVPHVIWFQGNLTVYHQKWHAGISLWTSLRYEKLKDIIFPQSDLHSFLQNRQFVRREKKIFGFAENFIGRTAWDQRLVSTMAPQAKYYHGDEIMRPAFHEYQWTPHEDRGHYVIVSTFRDNLYKGLETAMNAYKIIVPRLNKPLIWKIIGVPQNSHYERVCRGISGLSKDDDGFRILGLKSSTEMISELLDADIFVHPSHIDNSPNSLCEAMLMGLPVVSTNVGGIPSMLEDNHEGFLVQNGDEYAMGGAILTLLRDPDLARNLGLNARSRAIVRNDSEKIMNDILAVYYDILNRTKKDRNMPARNKSMPA